MSDKVRVLLVVLAVGLLVLAQPAPTAYVAAPQAAAAAPASTGTVPVDRLPAALRQAFEHAPFEARPLERGFRVTTAAYQADFTAGGTVFTAPGTADTKPGLWQYQLVALERGTVRVPQAPVAPVAENHVVEFRRPGLVERYVADGRGIEQIFVLDQLPAGAGDVELVGRVGSTLAATLRDGQVEYRDPARAAVNYGKPVAFDTEGRAIPVETRVQGDELRLRLDGEALAAATFPVTVDPVIVAAHAMYTDSDTWAKTDVAYNIERAEFGVVFAAETATGVEIWFKRFHATGYAVDASVAVTTGSGVYDGYPAIAYSRSTGEYLMVWERYGTDTATIHGQRISANGNLIDSAFLVSAATGINWDADVAASNYGPGGVPFLVTWRANTGSAGALEVWRRRVFPGGSPATAVQLSAAGGNAGPPRVAYDPIADSFFVVWTQDGQIVGSGVSNSSGDNLALVTVTTGTPDNPQSPDVAFDAASRQFLVAWTDDRDESDGHIYGQLLASGTPTKVGTDFAIDSNASEYPGSHAVVSAEPGGFIVLYEYVPGGTSSTTDRDKDIYGRYVYANGTVSSAPLGSVHQDAGAYPVNDDRAPSLATASPYGFTLAAWNHERTSDGLNTEAWVANLSGVFTCYVHGKSGNFDANGGADYWIFRPASGTWYVRSSEGNAQFSVRWGTAGDIPVLMDFDNDGQGDPGVFRPSNGTWYILDGNDLLTTTSVQFGAAGDIPVPGDYVGTTHDDYAVWRPWTGQWFIRDGQSGAVTMVQYGTVGDIPVPADWDGDGKREIGVFRPATGTWYTRELNGTDQQMVAWGTAGDIPLPGNYMGSANADYVVFRPSNGTWYLRNRITGTVTTRQFGTAGDVPMPLDRNGDGYLTPAVWRPATGRWFILNPDFSTYVAVDWGTAGDIPASGARNGG